MFRFVGLLVFSFAVGASLSYGQQEALPSLYEYFGTKDGNNVTGLVAEADGFKLNGKLIRLISGAMHYFRVHPSLWRDRLRKLRACGANTVETYVAWNLHEPMKDQFDFGDGNNDMSLLLNLTQFIQIAKEEDLLVLLRPGPFVCAEHTFGGLPSWLLRDPNMKVRTAYQPYLDRVKVYLDKLLPHIVDLQFTKGGPIVALQIENEYASFDKIETPYLEWIQKAYQENGIDSLLFTSDGSWNGDKGSLPGVLKTANFQFNPDSNLDDLLKFQPDKPPMVMEYWTGWFDHWFEPHSVTSIDDFTNVLEVILGKYNASVNFYMWHGGTNFGFNAGANAPGEAPFYAPDVTSYDYDAPLSEAGDYTDKYYKVLEFSDKYQIPTLRRPPFPPQSKKVAYPGLPLDKYLTFSDILEQVPSTSKFQVEHPISMENLDMNEGSGQSQGYILYRKRAVVGNSSVFRAGPVRDFGILLLDGEIQPFPKDGDGKTQYWLACEQNYTLQGTGGEHAIDLLIENMGRVNFGYAKDFVQHKGFVGSKVSAKESYHLDSQEIQDIQVMALEFKSAWVKNLTNWRSVNGSETLKAPLIVQSSFSLAVDGDTTPQDTFIDMSSWTKGIVFINGFNLGRYFNVGPQQTLYLPGPFLKDGLNTITIFEQLQAGKEIVFSAVPNLGPTSLKHPKPRFEDVDFLPVAN